MRQETIICVLGMSRSGTSLTTRILNLAGMYVGSEEELLVPMPDNPEGFWEHFRIMRLNEGILKSLGGSWRDPPQMPAGWESSEELEEARRAAAELVEDSFSGRDLWGWKDPRNCLTLPFWQALLPPIRYVICLRNPVDVVASLERRNGIDAERGFGLWFRYLASAIVHTAGRPRIFVSYEEYFDDWRRPAERLARFIGADPAAVGSTSAATVEAAVKEGLWHHHTSLEEAMRAEELPNGAAALHLIAEQLRVLGSTAEPADASAIERLAVFEGAVDAYARRGLVQRSSK